MKLAAERRRGAEGIAWAPPLHAVLHIPGGIAQLGGNSAQRGISS